MTYQVLARKWRPQEFSALIGQDSIKTALRNALEDGRVAQAYLFSGIRGVGKTTAARIFAKALNCEKGPRSDPCNECLTCREITSGADLDVIEVDAATYSKVEQIRELTESLRYGPARDRYKVVVIDEIHRLSPQAFDALLKIVEEPPAHLTFIFATTESEAVPATILSRCQEFHFRRVSAQEMSAHLRKLSEAEEITVSDRALRLLARAGEGSVRDSVALLDQLATFGGGSIQDDDAVRLLGGLDTALFERLLGAILEGRSSEVTDVVREIEDNGWDPRTAFSQFLAYCRDALHLALGADPAQLDLPADDITSLQELANESGYENLLRLVNQLLSSEQTVRRSETAALALEIAWLRAAELPKLQRLEELLGSAPPSTQENVGADAAPEESPAGISSTSVEPFLDRVRQRKASLRAHLDQAVLSFDASTLHIAYPPGDTLLTDALERNRQVLDEAVQFVWGPGTTWRSLELRRPAANPSTAPAPASLRAAEASAPPPSAELENKRQPKSQPSAPSPIGPSPEELEKAAEDPTVQTVLEIFGGTIESIEHHPPADSSELESTQ